MSSKNQTLRGPHRGRGRYLLRDLFTTAQSAPLTSPRVCEPGPGTLTLVDATDQHPTISGGRYVRPRPNSGQAYGNDGFSSVDGWTRTAGLMAYTIFQSAAMDRVFALAFNGAPGVGGVDSGSVMFSAPTQLALGTGGPIFAGSLSQGVDYQVAIVLRGNGCLLLMQGGAQYPVWTLIWALAAGILPTVYVGSPNFNAGCQTDVVAVLQKGGALASEFGKCSLFKPIVTPANAEVGLADGLSYFTWTPLAGETMSFYFRWIDDNNCYRIDCAQASGTIKLFRRVAGVDTELDAGKTQAWGTAGTLYRIGVIHAGGEIRTFVEPNAAAPVAKNVVTGESFNLAATGVKVSGFVAGANLEVWPRTFAGTDELSLA